MSRKFAGLHFGHLKVVDAHWLSIISFIVACFQVFKSISRWVCTTAIGNALKLNGGCDEMFGGYLAYPLYLQHIRQ